MVSKSVKTSFFISVSLTFTYLVVYAFGYNEIQDIILSHRNIKGEIDGYSHKLGLLIPSAINITMLLVFWVLIKKPHLCNYPIEITDNNREKAYYKMQLFLSVVAIVTSAIFSIVIYDSMGFFSKAYSMFFVISLMLGLIVFPVFSIWWFSKTESKVN